MKLSEQYPGGIETEVGYIPPVDEFVESTLSEAANQNDGQIVVKVEEEEIQDQQQKELLNNNEPSQEGQDKHVRFDGIPSIEGIEQEKSWKVLKLAINQNKSLEFIKFLVEEQKVDINWHNRCEGNAAMKALESDNFILAAYFIMQPHCNLGRLDRFDHNILHYLAGGYMNRYINKSTEDLNKTVNNSQGKRLEKVNEIIGHFKEIESLIKFIVEKKPSLIQSYNMENITPFERLIKNYKYLEDLYKEQEKLTKYQERAHIKPSSHISFGM